MKRKGFVERRSEGNTVALSFKNCPPFEQTKEKKTRPDCRYEVPARSFTTCAEIKGVGVYQLQVCRAITKNVPWTTHARVTGVLARFTDLHRVQNEINFLQIDIGET